MLFGKSSADSAELRRGLADRGGEPSRDRRVVSGGARVGFLRQPFAQSQRRAALVGVELGQDRAIIGGVDDNRDVVMVLGGGADHRWPADVDVFDAFVPIRRFSRSSPRRDRG